MSSFRLLHTHLLFFLMQHLIIHLHLIAASKRLILRLLDVDFERILIECRGNVRCLFLMLLEYSVFAISCADPCVELHRLVPDLFYVLITRSTIVPVQLDGKTDTLDRPSIPKLADYQQVLPLRRQAFVYHLVLPSGEVHRQEQILDILPRKCDQMFDQRCNSLLISLFVDS